DNIPNPLPDERGNIEYTNSQAVTSFEIAGITYLAFANQYRKNEVRKWNGNRFIDISDKVPDTLPDKRGNRQYSDSQAVTSFEIEDTTYLAFANQRQQNEVRKWNGNGFTDISATLPPVEGINHSWNGVTHFKQ
ncbi:MAG: hypothetical protein LBP53_07705, partial [Candidatus Peribacteria bacterium]|nr:hypothetical protein [Candidatus Peribacteria bacterium]